MKLLLIGCGNLGKILLKSWFDDKVAKEIIVVQPSLTAQPLFQGVLFIKHAKEIPKEFMPDVVVLATKPKHIKEILSEYLSFRDGSLFISLAAGISIKHLQQILGDTSKIIRIMPNTAIQVGESMNLAYSPKPLSDVYKELVSVLFAKTGHIIWLEKEELVDILTPISGSGPAYFFLLAQKLVRAATRQGIDEEMASMIIRQTLLGSAFLAKENKDFHQLKTAVASKGGVTEAALTVMDKKLEDLVEKAIEVALKKVEELGQ